MPFFIKLNDKYYWQNRVVAKVTKEKFLLAVFSVLSFFPP